jgi:hypothetical protein
LLSVVATIGKVRPSGLLFVDVVGSNRTALLVGTTRGVYLTWVSDTSVGTWVRLGDCSTFPLVMVMGLSYEASDDTLVVATMGRGVYLLRNALQAISGC